MAEQWDTAKDMLVLLAVVRISEIDVNLDVAERIVAGWRKRYASTLYGCLLTLYSCRNGRSPCRCRGYPESYRRDLAEG